MEYKKLLEKYDDMYICSTNIPSEYIIEIALEVGKAMDIKVDEKLIENTCENEFKKGKERVCSFSNSEEYKRYIFLDCRVTDLLYRIIVRCTKEESEMVKDALYKWKYIAREEYKQPISKERDSRFCPNLMNYENDKNPAYLSLAKNELI